MRVDVNLEGKAKDLVLGEQQERMKGGRLIGKERLINMLLTELYEVRLRNSIVTPTPMSQKEWKKYLKAK